MSSYLVCPEYGMSLGRNRYLEVDDEHLLAALLRAIDLSPTGMAVVRRVDEQEPGE